MLFPVIVRGGSDGRRADRGHAALDGRIGMLRALNRNVERMFDSTRKDTHWGKRDR
jgi:hypothetical protein